jgi:hypothetical protein
MNAKIDEDKNEFESIILGELEEGKKKDAKETAKEKEREKRNRDMKALEGLFAIARDKFKAVLKGKKQEPPEKYTEEESEEEEDSEVSEEEEDSKDSKEEEVRDEIEQQQQKQKNEENRGNMRNGRFGIFERFRKDGRFFKRDDKGAERDIIERQGNQQRIQRTLSSPTRKGQIGNENDNEDNKIHRQEFMELMKARKDNEARLEKEKLEQGFQETLSSPTPTPLSPIREMGNEVQGQPTATATSNNIDKLREQPQKDDNDIKSILNVAEKLQKPLDEAEQEKEREKNEARLAKERLEQQNILNQLKRQPSSQGKDISVDLFDILNKGLAAAPAAPSSFIVGGAADEYNDDTLKARYLEARPQRYSRITLDDPKIDELRNANKENKENGVSGNTDNKIEQLSNEIDVYNGLSSVEKDNPIKNNEMIQKIKRFEDDPKNPLEELELTFDDRIVFIIATFFVRYITIIMVQWCIDINIIKTFYEGFIYYAVIYIILFWFIVLFINIDNSFDVKYMNFNGIINSIRTLFYYFYMGTNGISRLLIHTSLILLLIIIPIILNIKKSNEYKPDDEHGSAKILDFEERKQLSKALSLFTMFIWLFTSIIATKF